ncbi:hypothetical protein I79_001620 [Cricetulus griseus]|uniref:Uncharacterized protein n=1 Tax=Cricetulus griseus TaxID=10029 RepID=G3GV89_CRIGR|nr:hypothetical protein I79_001620 [Cricetulus griseus]
MATQLQRSSGLRPHPISFLGFGGDLRCLHPSGAPAGRTDLNVVFWETNPQVPGSFRKLTVSLSQITFS